MNVVGEDTAEKADKFNERRAQLAASALLTLSELGYARTSLREIAHNSDFSHGVVHYYFRDKVDLILTGVQQYKSECVTRYDAIIEQSASVAELKTGFAAAMARTLRHDAPMHRLWYDLRAQSLFEDTLRPVVLEIDHGLEQMIWRVVSRLAALSGRPAAMAPVAAYALFDGLFQFFLLQYLSGRELAPEQLDLEIVRALDHAVPPA